MQNTSRSFNAPVIFLLIFSFSGWGLAVYLILRFPDIEKRLQNDIIKEIEYRSQVEDTIKKQVQTKRQEKELVIQLEYQRQLEDFMRQETEELSRKQEEYNNSQQESLAQKIQEYDARQDAYLKQVQESNAQQEGLVQQQLSLLKDNYQQYINELKTYRASLEGQIKGLESEYQNRLVQLREDLKRTIEEGLKRERDALKSYIDSKLAEAKQEICGRVSPVDTSGSAKDKSAE